MTERLGKATLAAFSGPCLPIQALGLPVVVYLPAFYASTVGIDLSTVGLIFMLVRLVDIAVDPVLGAAIDRTRSRYGRFRPWLVGGVPLLMLTVYLAFNPPPGSGALYLFVCMLALQVTFSVCHIAHMSWAAVLSADYHQRSRVYGWWQSSNTMGMILVLLLPSIVASQGGSHADGVRAMGWFVLLLLPITVGIAVFRVSEPATDKANHASWLSGVKLLGRRNVRQLLAADLALGLAAGMAGAVLLFFFRDTKGFAAADTGIFLLFYFVAGLIGAVAWTKVAFRFGKHRALAAAGVFYAVGQAALLLIPPGDRVIAILIYLLPGFAFTAFAFLLRAIMADVGDEERMESGQEKTGLLYSLVTAVSKLGYALSVGITFIALDLVGFVPEVGAANTPQALWGVQFLYVGTPVILGLLGAALIWRFPLDVRRHGEIRDRLEAAAATAQATYEEPVAPTPGAAAAGAERA